MFRHWILYTAFILTPVFVTGQSNNISLLWKSDVAIADDLFERNLYDEAIEYYLKATEVDYTPDRIYANLAECYRQLRMPEKAAAYYQVVLENTDVFREEYLFRYAESLLSTGQVKRARAVFDEYLALRPGDQRAINRMRGFNHWNDFFLDSLYFDVNVATFSSEASDIAPSYYKDGILITTAARQNLLIQRQYLQRYQENYHIYFLDPAQPDELQPLRIRGGVLNASTPAVSARGEIFIVGNKKRLIGKQDSITHLQLFSVRENDTLDWKAELTLPFVNGSFSYMSPWVNAGGDTLIFACNMPGGYGGFDLYRSVKRNDLWSAPANLGENINSMGDELYPFMVGRTLYFASDGWPGLGGLDIYQSDLEMRLFSESRNVGYPVNSHADDFAFIARESTGYFSSNRRGGPGKDDIYRFEKSPPEIFDVEIAVVDSISGESIPGISYTLLNTTLRERQEGIVDDRGILELKLQENQEILVEFSDPLFYPKAIEVSAITHSVNKKVELKRREVKTTFEAIVLDDIVYEFDMYHLRDDHIEGLDTLITTLQQNEYLYVEVEAHTDSRGEKDYNLDLSERRAKSIADYLVDAGVDIERITYHGMGESMLLNECEDNVPCTDQEHAVNRRTVVTIYEKDQKE